MIKFLDILKESDDNIFIPRGSKEEKDKVLIRRTNDKIQEYVKNGSKGDLDLRNSLIKLLPRNLTKVGGNLNLMLSQIEKLPDNLMVNGYLDLESCKNLKSLPNGLKVKYYLDLQGTNITSLPLDLEVGGNLILNHGNLILNHSQIEKLPDNLRVNGYLDLESCKNLKSLPNGLKVKYYLDLRHTNLTSLPSDLEVGEDLILYRTPIADMYTIEQIREMVPGVKGNIHLHL
jgi:hypothetical protein